MDRFDKLTRRDFLKNSALVTAAVIAAPSVSAPDPTANQSSQRLFTGWEHYRGSLGGAWEVWRGGKVGDQVVWQKVELPHCFNARDAVDPDEVYYRGQGWYRTNLKIENPFPHGRTLLHFEGAGQKSRVFVDLVQVAEHVGGYDEWTVDITGAAAKVSANAHDKGTVPLAIVCDNSRDVEMIPSDLSDFNLYGGLYRYLNLVYVPLISIERVHILPALQPDGSAEVTISARLYTPAPAADLLTVAIQVFDPSGAVIHNLKQTFGSWTGERAITKFVVAKPELWSPAEPHLYRCEFTLSSPHGDMTGQERFGVRHYEFIDHGPFKLNGERLLLKGTQRHEDHAGLGAAMTEDLIREELEMVKDMGANFIRLGHYQQSRIVLDACDELGIMVWEEIPWCRSGVGGQRWQEQTHRMLHNMIDQHYNHPAIIIWGLGNENDWPGEFPSEDR